MKARLCIVPPAGEPVADWRDETARLRARIREVEADLDRERSRSAKLAARLSVEANRRWVAEATLAGRAGEPWPEMPAEMLEVCS